MTALATIIPLSDGTTVLDLGDIPLPFADRESAVAYAEALGFRCALADPPVERPQ